MVVTIISSIDTRHKTCVVVATCPPRVWGGEVVTHIQFVWDVCGWGVLYWMVIFVTRGQQQVGRGGSPIFPLTWFENKGVFVSV